MACTNRIHLYAKSLLETNNEVDILIPRQTERPDNVKNSLPEGEYEGVRFKYASKTTARSHQRTKNIINDFKSLINSFFLILKLQPSVILLTGSFLRFTILAKLCSILINAKLVRERNEAPFCKDSQLSQFKRAIIRFEYIFFDGIVVISKRL